MDALATRRNAVHISGVRLVVVLPVHPERPVVRVTDIKMCRYVEYIEPPTVQGIADPSVTVAGQPSPGVHETGPTLVDLYLDMKRRSDETGGVNDVARVRLEHGEHGVGAMYAPGLVV